MATCPIHRQRGEVTRRRTRANVASATGLMSLDSVKMAAWDRTPAWSLWASASSRVRTASSRPSESPAKERGDGRLTRVWIDGVADPLIASRTEVTILRDMGQESAIAGPDLDEALDLAARLAAAAEAGRVDLSDLGRRARHLLASTTASV
jgi:hypothetical protein